MRESMIQNFFNKKLYVFSLLLMFTGCGTQFTCAGEVAAPPEREFWCSPFKKVGKIFSVQKIYSNSSNNKIDKLKKQTVCENTIGGKECNVKE